LIVIEAPLDKSVPWMEPRDANESLFLGIGTTSVLAHSGGIHVAFADGRDFHLPADAPAWYRRARLTIAGNERIDDPYR
jgi:prepilin-type processing-associated H-X9-DG protein